MELPAMNLIGGLGEVLQRSSGVPVLDGKVHRVFPLSLKLGQHCSQVVYNLQRNAWRKIRSTIMNKYMFKSRSRNRIKDLFQSRIRAGTGAGA